MEILRTPDDRFERLPEWPYEARYVEVPSGDGSRLRIHYVDEGPSNAAPVLLLHGEPSWSFLYRKVIEQITGAGLRAVAPDLIGFGRSDKPVKRSHYTYQRHVDWMGGFIEELGLNNITLVGQDWGGLIGLRIAAEDEGRFDRIVAANTFLPTGDMPMPEAFRRWQNYSQEAEEFPVGWLVNRGCATDLPPETIAAYDAPFPDESYKAGARQFPMLVPTSPEDPATPANRRAWEVLSRWEKPFLTAFGDSDPITRGGDLFFQTAVPGAKGQPHVVLEGAAHYLQEDKGEDLGRVIADFVTATS
jgi:haloalkane dehalogenase